MTIKFWQVYRYARFILDGITYRKLHKRYDATYGIVNAQNVATGDKVYIMDGVDVTPVESQHFTRLQPMTCEKRLRRR